MATLTMAAASGVLKDKYLPGFRLNLNDELGTLYTILEGSSENVVGETVILSMHTGRNVGTGSRAELETLPTAGTQKYTKSNHDLKYHYAQIEFTGQVMRRAKTDPGAFIDAAGLEMERVELDLKHDLNRQAYNDAEQAIAVTSGVATGLVVPIVGATPEQYRALLEGMRVDIGSTGVRADGADSVVIESVDTVAETVTFEAGSALGSVAANMFIRKEDNFGNEMTGLRQIINAQDTIFGVDGTAVRVWNSYVDENGGTPRNLTEDLLEVAIDEISIDSGIVPNVCVAPHLPVRTLASQLNADRRYNDTVDFEGGFKGLHVQTGSGRVTVMTDRFAPAGTLWMVNTENLWFSEASDWEFMQEDGAVLDRIPNVDGYRATLFKYCDLVTERRNSMGRIDDLQ